MKDIIGLKVHGIIHLYANEYYLTDKTGIEILLNSEDTSLKKITTEKYQQFSIGRLDIEGINLNL